ncbi:MAG: 16S rRNA (adenine(1518)-N(6)/adenine(1519)-N(6))-dimethyltransferase RsmA [Clostridia bacterium]|jgi:16S rRNA (adenine1518-N6/adenine1519-N6)-dimethyltransferase|nr:16S rRNA (adenine(1518)-N(6)/adenine(1519)-N(6))-dimethyltransferase RsmA [Clostridia bacterium]
MTDKISTPLKTKELIEKYGFYFKKNFGQNFLIDSNVLSNIVSAAEIQKDDFVLEIGPGIGSLTQYLAESAGYVTAIEIDKNLIPILSETMNGYDNFEVINEDVLKLDINALIAENGNGKKAKLVANLPYYITTPIIMEILEKHADIKSMTVMVQKEVASRMLAKPKSKDYGALTAAVQFYCNAKLDFIVKPNCFMPRPKVDSAVITLKIKDKPISVKNQEFMFKIIKCAFGQRRKTLLNSLFNQGGFGLSKDELTLILKNMDLDSRVRGEELSVEEFAYLSDSIYEKINYK